MVNSDIPPGYLMDSKGRLVPQRQIKEIDIARDSLVKEIAQKAKDVSLVLKKFKESAIADIGAFADLSAEKYGVKLGGAKGNLTLVSFDGQYRVQVAIAETLVFDERLHAAKALIDECMNDWSAGSAEELKTVIRGYFDVDKQGKLNTKKILSLRRYHINDDRWKRAMDAISDSLQIIGSKSYVRVYKRDQNGDYNQLPLDLSSF